MNIKNLLLDFVVNFALILVVAAVVSFIYSLIVHGSGTVDWGNAFRLALTFGIVLSWLRAREKQKTT